MKVTFFAPRYHQLMIQRGTTLQNTLVSGSVVVVEKRIPPFQFQDGTLTVDNKKDAIELVKLNCFGQWYMLKDGVELISEKNKAYKVLDRIFGAVKEDVVELMTHELDDTSDDELQQLIADTEEVVVEEEKAEIIPVEEVTNFSEAREYLMDRYDVESTLIKRLSDAHILAEDNGISFPNLNKPK